MSTPRVLLLGGHGKVSLFMTPLMLERSWNVTSVVRNPDHREEILKFNTANRKGKVDVLVSSIEDIQSESDAQKLIDQVKPNYVVWSAGAGGKGGASRTYAVDRDAAKKVIKASINTPSVTKFLLVSYVASRKNRAPWWTDDDWKSAQRVNNEILPDYYKAKVDADEYLTALAQARKASGDENFQSILLRPGTLTDGSPTGKVHLGKTSASGKIDRADVASVAVSLLARGDTRGWLDLLLGEDDVEAAVSKAVKEGVDCVEGEDLDRIYAITT